MKRIIALLLCIGLFAAVASGCGGSGKKAVATGDEAVSKNAADYKNDFNGLCTYLSALGYINPLEDNKGVTFSVMKADIIGAKQGRKFTAMHRKDGNVSIEIYEFDLKKLASTPDEAATTVLNSVKKDGTFVNLVGETVKNVYLSNKGRYMMIYTDASINGDTKTTDKNYKAREEVVKNFKNFDR